MAQRLRRRGWQVVAAGVGTGALLVTWPTAGPASAGTASAGPRTLSAAVGNTFGGLTEQGNPVVVDLSSTRRKVVRAVVSIDAECTSGLSAFTDRYGDLSVNRFGRFRRSFGPVTEANGDGTTTEYSGRIAGQLNDARTRITGVWRLVAVDRDAAGAVTDSCDSGLVSWKAKN